MSKRKNDLLLIGILSITIFLGILQLFDPFQHQMDPTTVINSHHETPLYKSLQEFIAGPIQDHNGIEDTIQEKENILALLEQAGVKRTSLTRNEIHNLPSDHLLDSMYGDQIRIYGQHTCSDYQGTVPLQDRYASVAGMFNTGTNLLAHHLMDNLIIESKILIGSMQLAPWQVPWGKHRRVDLSRFKHTAEGMEMLSHQNVLPIVMIRHPLAFFQSTCATPYGAQWRHGPSHCPNLIPSDDDRKRYKHLKETFGVRIKHDKANIEHYPSLIELWNSFYRAYLDSNLPFLMVRFEDMLLRPTQVMQAIADCTGGRVNRPYRFRLESAKLHGSHTNFVQAVVKTGNVQHLVHNMTKEDLDYARSHADPQIMRLFHYVI